LPRIQGNYRQSLSRESPPENRSFVVSPAVPCDNKQGAALFELRIPEQLDGLEIFADKFKQKCFVMKQKEKSVFSEFLIAGPE